MSADRSRIREAIPAIGALGSDKLRTTVTAAWVESWRRSSYADLADVPEGLGTGRRSLLRHVNEVNGRVDGLIRIAVDDFGLSVDHDRALAAAILHDVDKPLLIAAGDDGIPAWGPGHTGRDHGPVGADLLRECGVDEEIAGIVEGHSPYLPLVTLRRSVEAVIVHHADLLAADLRDLAMGRVPQCGKTVLTTVK